MDSPSEKVPVKLAVIVQLTASLTHAERWCDDHYILICECVNVQVNVTLLNDGLIVLIVLWKNASGTATSGLQ